MKHNGFFIAAAVLLAAVLLAAVPLVSGSPADYAFIDITSDISGDLVLNQTESLRWSDYSSGTIHSYEWNRQHRITDPGSYTTSIIFDMEVGNESGSWNYRRTGSSGSFSVSGTWPVINTSPTWNPYRQSGPAFSPISFGGMQSPFTHTTPLFPRSHFSVF